MELVNEAVELIIKFLFLFFEIAQSLQFYFMFPFKFADAGFFLVDLLLALLEVLFDLFVELFGFSESLNRLFEFFERF